MELSLKKFKALLDVGQTTEMYDRSAQRRTAGKPYRTPVRNIAARPQPLFGVNSYGKIKTVYIAMLLSTCVRRVSLCV